MTDKPITQRSHEWRVLRLGAVTASRFKDVLSNPQTKAAREAGEFSASAESYMIEKLTEMLYGKPLDVWHTEATRWGQENEPEAFERAIPAIARRFGRKLILPDGDNAFIEHPTESHVGCSPDGLVGDDMLCEIKCPYNPANHVWTYWTGLMPKQHMPQVQGSLWVTGRQRYAFISFDPRIEEAGIDPLVCIEVQRDEEYIEHLAARVIRFRDELLRRYETVRSRVDPF